MNPPRLPPTPLPNTSPFTFLPPNLNPNPYLLHPHPPSSSTTATPPPPDLPTTLSTLKDLIQHSETALNSVSTLLRTNPTASFSSGLCTCPFNPHHRVPLESLFRHSLRCPSSPSTIDLSLLHSLNYPNTLQSSDSLIQQNRFIRDAGTTELCFSLDDYADLGSNFFYRDCPGVVLTSADQDSMNRTLTLPGVLSAECANFTSRGGGDRDRGGNGFCTDCLRLLPSELWFVRRETEAWNDYPTSYSNCVLRAILCSHITSKWCNFLRWLIVFSPRYGVVIDVPMRDHIFLLFRLCFKAITREAIGSAEFLFNREPKELSLKNTSFKCPILGQVLMWLASQFSILYGEASGKLFAVEMVKQCLLNCSLNTLMFSEVQKGTESLALKEVDGKLEQPLERSITVGEVIFVSQVAAAVAALHERSLLEEKIKAARYSQQLGSYQRMIEHSYVTKGADEERQKRSDYRPILEHDGLLWQRARNQETNKMKSREELLAEERDYKRRRMSYRGKKMKRTTTQVMRDIIEEYMEDIKQAGGFGCLLKGAEQAGPLASEPFSVRDISTENEIKKSVPNLSEVSRGWSHGYGKQLLSHSKDRSSICEDEFSEDSRQYRRASHWHHGHLEDQISDRNRDYNWRSQVGQRSNGHSREKIINQEQRDDAEVSKKYFHRSSDRSHCRSHEQSSHRRDRVGQSVEDKDSRQRITHKNRRSDSVTRHEFEDRYDPSISRDMYEDDLYSGSKYVGPD